MLHVHVHIYLKFKKIVIHLGQSTKNWIMAFLWYLIIGGFAGWLAGQIMKGKGFGILGNIGIGIVGGIFGGWIFRFLGFSTESILGSLITAVVGAIVLLWIINFFKKK